MVSGFVRKNLGYTTLVAAARTSRATPFPSAPIPRSAGATSAAAPLTIGFPFRLLLLLSLLPLLLVTSLLVVYRQQETDRIYPGVAVLDVPLGRLTRDEAAAAIKRRISTEARRKLLVRYDDDAYILSLAEMGLKIEDQQIAAWVDDAWTVGRAGGFTEWLRTQLSLLRSGHHIPAVLGVDHARASAVLGRIALEVERQMVNADIGVGKAGNGFEIHITPAFTGRRLNINATINRLERSLVDNLPTTLDLVLDEARPAIDDADVGLARDAIQVILGSPLEFKDKDGSRSWKLETAAAFGMLEITGRDTGRPPLSARLNDAKLRDFVEMLAKDADQPAKNPALDVGGDQIVISPGGPGRLMDVNATFELAKGQAVSSNRTVEMAFTEDKPWLAESDLEPFKTQANTLLDLSITLETPIAEGIADRKWVLDRAQLAELLLLPNTQAAPRNYVELPAAQRPRFEVQLDSGKATNFLAREVAPWVSLDPVDASLELA